MCLTLKTSYILQCKVNVIEGFSNRCDEFCCRSVDVFTSNRLVCCFCLLLNASSFAASLHACVFHVHVCLGGLFSKTEMSEVLTEILKADPSFDKDSFLKQCEHDIIPNILEVSKQCSYQLLHLHHLSSAHCTNRPSCS